MSKKVRAAAVGGTTEYPESAADNRSPDAPAETEIAALAWSYWEARGFQGGSPEDDWYRAQAELTRRRTPRLDTPPSESD